MQGLQVHCNTSYFIRKSLPGEFSFDDVFELTGLLLLGTKHHNGELLHMASLGP